MKRYNFFPVNHQSGNRIEAEDGEYVAAEDALRLQSELTKARELNEELRELLDLVRDEDGTYYTNKLKARIAAALSTPIAHNADEICGQDSEAAKGDDRA